MRSLLLGIFLLSLFGAFTNKSKIETDQNETLRSVSKLHLEEENI